MALRIPSGNGPSTPVFHFLLTSVFFLGISSAQTPALTCGTSATNLVNRSEGLSEPTGNIVLNCSGGTPGATVTANITVTYPVAITNRVSASGTPDILLTVDSGSGPVPNPVAPVLAALNVVSFNGVTFTVPASRGVTIQIDNVRVAMTTFTPNVPMTASISTAALALNNSQVVVATPMRALLATLAPNGITCVGSPLPSTINLANLFATGTRFVSTRVTTGFAGAFAVKGPGIDSGTRIIARYANFPAGSRVFVPDLVAGSDALQPTAAGDLGVAQSGGAYAPSAGGSLLLARVQGADASGAGGTPIITKAAVAGTITPNTVNELTLSNGAGSAVYEVVDSNPSISESAQFPTFLGLATIPAQTPVIATEAITLAPVSTAGTADQFSPVPRYLASVPPPDCQALGDCNAGYFPMLGVDMTAIQFNTLFGSIFQTQYVRVHNNGGGLMDYAASIAFQGQGGWLTVDPPTGSGNSTLRVDAIPATLAVGVYHATLTINAGTAGVKNIPVTLTVGQIPVTISSVTNAATFQPGPLVAGSLATIKGVYFGGKSVGVTFDGLPGTILYSDAGQINVQIPASLVSKMSTQVVVTVDGSASTPQTIALAAVAPGIFGTLNQDSTLNTPANPAAGGTIIQIFATGLKSALSGAITVNIQGQNGLMPIYADTAPGINGVQQVNVVVPMGLTAGPAQLFVCAVAPGNTQPVCSPASTLSVK